MFGHVAHQPSEHSSREQQRIAIARALIVDPYLLIANEPTGNFVKCTTKAVKETLTEVRYGKTILMITHNEELSVYADKVYRLRQGGWSGSLFFCPPCQSGWRSTNKGMATSSYYYEKKRRPVYTSAGRRCWPDEPPLRKLRHLRASESSRGIFLRIRYSSVKYTNMNRSGGSTVLCCVLGENINLREQEILTVALFDCVPPLLQMWLIPFISHIPMRVSLPKTGPNSTQEKAPRVVMINSWWAWLWATARRILSS